MELYELKQGVSTHLEKLRSLGESLWLSSEKETDWRLWQTDFRRRLLVGSKESAIRDFAMRNSLKDIVDTMKACWSSWNHWMKRQRLKKWSGWRIIRDGFWWVCGSQWKLWSLWDSGLTFTWIRSKQCDSGTASGCRRNRILWLGQHVDIACTPAMPKRKAGKWRC